MDTKHRHQVAEAFTLAMSRAREVMPAEVCDLVESKIRIRYNGRLSRSLARAIYRKRAGVILLEIEIASRSLGALIAEGLLYEVVSHEVAHTLLHAAGDLDHDHGDRWAALHRALGGTGSRTLRVKGGPKPRRHPRFDLVCECRSYGRVTRQKFTIRDYGNRACRSCGSRLRLGAEVTA